MDTTTDPPKPVAVGWHRHRWTRWGDVFDERAPLAAPFVGSLPPWWQERRCIRCRMAERRRVDLPTVDGAR